MPTEVLAVPGAHLHYQVRGSGPVLLLIPGGVMDAAMFARVVVPLADRYTVVTYDPRGISSSTLDGPAADVPVDLQAAMHTLFVGDFDARISQIAERGLEPAERETYANGVRKATFRDPDGNEIGSGGAPA